MYLYNEILYFIFSKVLIQILFARYSVEIIQTQPLSDFTDDQIHM